MDRPSQISVERSARGLARRVFSGSPPVVRRRGNHVVIVAEAIRRRWGVAPSSWKAKHCRWFLEIEKSNCSSGTRYRYYTCIKKILIHQDRWQDWKNALRGSWTQPK